jgi:hypothetical protein
LTGEQFLNKILEMEFRWDDWNLEHAARHGVPPEESEHVVRFARRPYPRRHGRGKWYVLGRGTMDYLLLVLAADHELNR